MTDFARLLLTAQNRGWEAAIRNHYGAESVYDLLACDRNAALPILTAPKGARILDLECGLGACAIALAKTGASVCATSSRGELPHLLGIRCREQNVPHVQPYAGGIRALRDRATFDGVISPYTPQTLDAVARHVGADGVLWLSFGDSPLGAPKSRYRDRTVASRLRALGFRMMKTYVAHPSSQNLSVLLEEGHPGGAAYVLGSRTGATRVLSWMQPVLPILAKRLSRGAWLYARRSESTSPGPLSLAKESCAIPDDTTAPVIWANRGTFTVPVWKGRPVAVVRVDAARQRVEHECAILEWVEHHVTFSTGDRVPRIRWRGLTGDRTVAVQTALDGRPRRRVSIRRDAPKVARFLTALSKAGLPPSGTSSSESAFSHLYGCVDTLGAALRSNEAATRIVGIHDVIRESLPAVLAHGDFHPGNVLFNSDGLSVFDWEYAGPGWQGQDWFYFFGSVICDGVNAQRAGARLRALIVSGDRRSLSFRRQTASFLKTVGVPDTLTSLVTALGLVDFARRRFPLPERFDFDNLLSSCLQEAS